MLLSVNTKHKVEFGRQVYFICKYFCEHGISEKLEEELNHEGFEVQGNKISNGSSNLVFDYIKAGYFTANFIIPSKLMITIRTTENDFRGEVVFNEIKDDVATEIIRKYFQELFNVIEPYMN